MASSFSASVHFIVIAFIQHLITPAGAFAFPIDDRPSTNESLRSFDHVLPDLHRREGGGESTEEPSSYAGLSKYSGAMTAHIICMIVAWVFVLPIAVVFGISKHDCTLFFRLVFLCLSISGVGFAKMVTLHTADLYQGNAHHGIGWIAMAIVTLQMLIGLFARCTGRSRASHRSSTMPTIHGHYASVKLLLRSVHWRWSGRYERLVNTSSRNPEAHSAASEDQTSMAPEYDRSDSGYDDNDSEYKTLVSDPANEGENLRNAIRAPLSNLKSIKPRLIQTISILDKCIDWTIMILGYVALLTGIVTYTGIFRGDHIFNGLAHFIKGSIFFWYGLLTLGRWLGCFASVGWAWNVRLSNTKSKWVARVPSAEFVESFVIFLYGSTNVFLEHLAGWGEAWTASDLEHLSISILFFGGGLLGMLVESTRIRNLLSRNIPRTTHTHSPPTHAPLPTTSTNPLPALTILLLGILMSSHHQSSALSTSIHAQWGILLACFGLLRILTYIVLSTFPPTSPYPSRPPTELLTSFCLIVGGIVFCASTEDVVDWLEGEKVMGMFVLTLAAASGLVVMAWEVVVVGVKRWAGDSRDTEPLR